MCEAIFKILTIGKSLELIMASYQLLNELDKVIVAHLQFFLHFIFMGGKCSNNFIYEVLS